MQEITEVLAFCFSASPPPLKEETGDLGMGKKMFFVYINLLSELTFYYD